MSTRSGLGLCTVVPSRRIGTLPSHCLFVFLIAAFSKLLIWASSVPSVFSLISVSVLASIVGGRCSFMFRVSVMIGCWELVASNPQSRRLALRASIPSIGVLVEENSVPKEPRKKLGRWLMGRGSHSFDSGREGESTLAGCHCADGLGNWLWMRVCSLG